jgi:ABC-type transporter Mla subunit MlaD
LDKSIQPAEKPVGDLIDAIRADMAGFQVRREQAFSLKLSTATSRYNNEAKKATPDLDQLARLADRIKAISDQRDQLANSNPDRALGM